MSIDLVVGTAITETKCQCSKCSEMVKTDEWTYPYCNKCYANIDGVCD